MTFIPKPKNTYPSVRKTREECEKDGFVLIAGPYAPGEYALLSRAVTDFAKDGIPYLVVEENPENKPGVLNLYRTTTGYIREGGESNEY